MTENINSPGSDGSIRDVLIHPPLDKPYVSFEMPVMPGAPLGDALACDCVVVRFAGKPWLQIRFDLNALAVLWDRLDETW